MIIMNVPLILATQPMDASIMMLFVRIIMLVNPLNAILIQVVFILIFLMIAGTKITVILILRSIYWLY